MTTEELSQYYANLLIRQYRGKDKAYDTVQKVIEPLIMDQLPVAVQDAYDPSNCVGVQLDVIGKYVGCSRNGNGDTGPITLDDSDFRVLINICIIKNTTSSSLASIQNLLWQFFHGGIQVFDLQNMQMNYTVSATIASEELVQYLKNSDFLPRPMGVQLASITYVTTEGNLFGFVTYELPVNTASPFNDYATYNEDYPWLEY